MCRSGCRPGRKGSSCRAKLPGRWARCKGAKGRLAPGQPAPPHPEEPRKARRLEGWAKDDVCGPPFETRPCGPLLRVRRYWFRDSSGQPRQFPPVDALADEGALVGQRRGEVRIALGLFL